jgi:hypothetical protein
MNETRTHSLAQYRQAVGKQCVDIDAREAFLCSRLLLDDSNGIDHRLGMKFSQHTNQFLGVDNIDSRITIIISRSEQAEPCIGARITPECYAHFMLSLPLAQQLVAQHAIAAQYQDAQVPASLFSARSHPSRRSRSKLRSKLAR